MIQVTYILNVYLNILFSIKKFSAYYSRVSTFSVRSEAAHKYNVWNLIKKSNDILDKFHYASTSHINFC